MQKTSIEWALNPDGTPGYTWNPVSGCLNSCPYCYARKVANTRLKNIYLDNNNVAPILKKEHQGDPFYPRFWPEKLEEPLKHKNPAGIFVCSMSDLFGIGIPEDWTKWVLDIVRRSPQHRFYLLTKQPQNLAKFSPFPDNCWVGVSATNDISFMEAYCMLANTVEAKVKFISLEPFLGEISTGHIACFAKHIDWVIIGSQTKPIVMPKIEWVKEIVQAADWAGCKVFLKDSLTPFPESSYGCLLTQRKPEGDWVLRQEIPLL